MDVACGDCGHKFFLRGNLDPTVAQGGCENCGGRNIYRRIPSPVNSEMTERNMPLDGKHPDTGGNPLQEGILADDGWEPYSKRDESFAASVRVGQDIGDLTFDFGGNGPQVTHTVIATPEGRIHSLPGEAYHEQVADAHNLHALGYPRGMSLGYVNDDGSTQWFQHDSRLPPEQLANAVQNHLASIYGAHVPVTVDPNLRPSTNEERWFGDQFAGPQRELDVLNGPARPRMMGNPLPGEKEWQLRGGAVNDTLNTEPYDSFFHQADTPDAEFNAPQTDPSGLYSAEVQPGPGGIHAGTNHWLKFFNANVNGLNARDHHAEIVDRYGLPTSPEFGQPVTVSVEHPDHLPAVVESIEQSAQGHKPTPETARVGQAIQQGLIPWPSGVGPGNVREGHTKTAAPLAAIPELAGGAAAAGEAAGAGAAAGGAAGGSGLMSGIGGRLMQGALMGAGSHAMQSELGPVGGGGGGGTQAPQMQMMSPLPPPVAAEHTADLPGLDTPSSVPRMPTTDDPEQIDPHEINDGQQDKTQYGGDQGAGGSQGVPFDADDTAELTRLFPKLIDYYHSDESGLNDPEIRALHERLQTKHPGYLERGDDAALQNFLQSLREPQGVTARRHVSLEGERILLSDLSLDDENEFLRFASENVDFHEPYAPLPKSGDAYAYHLKQRRMLAVSNKQSGELLGFYTIHQDGSDAEVGVAASHRFARQGYMNEAADLLKQAASGLGIKRWIAKADPSNEKSIAFLKKRGYTHQGGELWTKWVEPLDDPFPKDAHRLAAFPQHQGYGAQPMMQTGPPYGTPNTALGIQPQPQQMQQMQQQQPWQQGTCPNCGGVLTADGSCPQCGNKINTGNGSGNTISQPGVSTAPGAMPTNTLQASVHEADSQGPITPEQRAAVSDLLVNEGRADEIPIMERQPWQYAKELARVQRNPNEPPPPVDPSEVTPMPAQEVAPPGATMPVPDPSQQIASAVAKFAADSYAPRCPRCGSASTGYQNTNGDAFCHACKKTWTPGNIVEQKFGDTFTDQPNAPNTPAADQMHQRDVEQEQDSSLSWQDENGQPLQTGKTYYMKTPQYEVPDLVRIENIKPDSIQVTEIGEVVNPLGDPNADSNNLNYTHEVSRQDLEMDNLTFEPADEGAQQSDLRNNVQDVTGPNTEPQVHQVQTSSVLDRLAALREEASSDPDLMVEIDRTIANVKRKQAEAERLNEAREAEHVHVDAEEAQSCPECGERNRITTSMSSPTTLMHDCHRCANVWETSEQDSTVTAGTERRSWVLEDGGFDDPLGFTPPMQMSSGSRNISDIALKDEGYQQRKKLLAQRAAGRQFTHIEKREFIDEDGIARNADKLDLSGTHYEGAYKTRDTADGRGYLAPDEHLVLGM